jgi:DNA-binding SARP family transcriptional activator
MEFGVLGTLLVRSGDDPVPVPGPKLRALLAALLLQSNRAVSRESLVEVVWDGRPPPEALGTLRSYVMRLRRTLGPEAGDRIVTRSTGYAIELDDEEFDLRRFQAAQTRARDSAAAGDWAAVSEILTAALALWRGEPLADVPAQETLRDDIGALAEARLQAQHQRIAADLELGRHEDILAELRELTARYPLHELFRAQFMLALYRAGRQAEALAAYRDARWLLVDELGVDPTPQLQALHERILNADPTLSAPAAEPHPAPEDAGAGAGTADRTGSEYVVPRQLPRAIEHFTGRVDELGILAKMMSGEGRAPGTVVISAVAGTGGVGKTALAVHWAHQVADQYPDGQLYVNLQGFDPRRPPLSPDQAVRGFLDALGVQPARVPVGLDAQSALYRSLIADRRVLVLLDNAATAEQVRPLLPGSPDCVVVVTSRNRLTSLVAAEGARPVPLDILSVGDARDLLTARLGAQTVLLESAAADELIDLCARLPLALNIVASFAAFQRDCPLRGLTERLRGARVRLDTLNAGDPATDLRVVFACSYQGLSPSAAGLFRLLGLHPGPDFTPEVAASLAARPVAAIRPLLAELTVSSLLTEHEPGRFAFHDLLRAYALERCEAEESVAARQEATSRLLGWYLGTVGAVSRLIDPLAPPVGSDPRPGMAAPLAFAEVTDALAWGDIERQNLSAAVFHAADHGHDQYAWKLAVSLQHQYNRSCRWDDWSATHQAARVSACRLGDPAAQGLLLQSIGWLYTRTHRADQGIELLHQSAALLREAGDREGEAMTNSNLGNAHMQLGQWDQAIERFQAVMAVHRELGYRRGEGIAASNLGVCLHYLDRYDEAEAVATRAYALNSEIGNRSSQVVSLVTLAVVSSRRRDFPSAFAHINEALQVRREIGDRFGEACVLEDLAKVHLAVPDPASAIVALTEAEAIFADLDPEWAADERAWIEELRRGLPSDVK